MEENKINQSKLGEWAERLSIAVVGTLFAIINIWLLLLCGFSTSYISKREKTYITGDSMLLHIIAAVLFIAVLYIIRRKCDTLKAAVRRLPFCGSMDFAQAKRLLLYIIFAMGLIWVLATQFEPVADQNSVMEAASGLHTKDYTAFAEGGYISSFPQQNGLMLILYALGLAFGGYNYIVFQIINVFGVVFSYKLLSELGELFGLSKGGQLAVLLSGIFFFPLTMYATFVYGNVLGLTFSLAAIKQLVLMPDGNRRRIFLAAIFIAVGVAFKNNYLIFLVGMLLFALVKCFGGNRKRYIAFILIALVLYTAQATLPRMLIQRKTGYDMTSGVSTYSYIAMGLQDSKKRAPGWYNEYNDNTYREAGYDNALQTEICKADIKQSISDFLSGKRDAVEFFSRKTASQWNNPTFQCFWIAQCCDVSVQANAWVRAVLSIPFTNAVTKYLDIIQFLTLLGSLLALALCRRDWHRGAFLLEMLVVGGFIFHMFWEAKGQYTITYFVLLFPCAAAGYTTLLDRIAALADRKQAVSAPNKHKRVNLRVIALAAVTAVAVAASFTVPAAAKFLRTSGDEDAWLYYVWEHTEPYLEDGIYTIAAYTDQESYLGTEPSGEEMDDITLGEKQAIRLIFYDDVVRIRFTDTKRYLELYTDYMDPFIVGRNRRTHPNQEWSIAYAEEDNCYFIYMNKNSGEYALTRDENGEVSVQEFDGSDSQKWVVLRDDSQ